MKGLRKYLVSGKYSVNASCCCCSWYVHCQQEHFLVITMIKKEEYFQESTGNSAIFLMRLEQILRVIPMFNLLHAFIQLFVSQTN